MSKGPKSKPTSTDKAKEWALWVGLGGLAYLVITLTLGNPIGMIEFANTHCVDQHIGNKECRALYRQSHNR